MKSNIGYLLKLQYFNQSVFNAIRHEKNPKKRSRMIGVLCAMGFVIIMLIGYSFAIGYGYGYLGMAQVLPGYSIAITSIIILVFTFAKTNGFLFAYRDYDILMSLPFSTSTIITSKFLYMYINNLLFSMGVMIPMGIAYAIWEQPGISAYMIWLLITCFTPLIPMTIASFVGTVIAAIGSKFRFKVFVQAVLTIVLVLGITGISFAFGGAETNQELLQKMEEIGEVLQSQIHKLYPMSVLFEKAVNEQSVLSAFAFILLSIAVYLIFVIIVSRKYKEINTALMTGYTESNYKVGKLESHSVMYALVKKEAKRFTSSIAYLMNVGMGMILAVSAAVICLIMGMDDILEMMQLGVQQEKILYVIPFVMAVPLTMTCTTSVSLSLEGRNLWILQSLPMEESMIYKGKMAFNMILLLPAALLCNLCFIIALKPDFITAVLYLLVTFAVISLSTVLGMWFGIQFANFTWENEIEVIKQGMASMLGIFVNMFLEIILAVLVYLFSTIIDGRVILLAIAVLMLGSSWLLYGRIMKKKVEKQ